MVIKLKADLELIEQDMVANYADSPCEGCIFDGGKLQDMCDKINEIQRCDSPRFTKHMVYTIKNANVKERVL